VENLSEDKFVFREWLPLGSKRHDECTEDRPDEFTRNARVRWTCRPHMKGECGVLGASFCTAGDSHQLVFGVAPREALAASQGAQTQTQRISTTVSDAPRSSSTNASPNPDSVLAFKATLMRMGKQPAEEVVVQMFQNPGAYSDSTCEWLVVREESNVLEVRLRLRPQEGSGDLSPVRAPEAAALPEELTAPPVVQDEATLQRIHGQLLVAEQLCTQANETDKLLGRVPLHPSQIRTLPEKVRVDLVLAILAELLESRQSLLRNLGRAGIQQQGVHDKNAAGNTTDQSGLDFFAETFFGGNSVASGPPCAPGAARRGRERAAEEAKQDVLAKHARRVYENLVSLVGFENDRAVAKMSQLSSMYLPRASDPDHHQAELPDLPRLCEGIQIGLKSWPAIEELAGTQPASSTSAGASVAPVAAAAADAGTVASVQVGESSSPSQSESKTTESWAEDWSFELCEFGEEETFAGKVWLLDPDLVSTLNHASKLLSKGYLVVPEDICAVRCSEESQYYLLARSREALEEAKQRLQSPASSGKSPQGDRWKTFQEKATPPTAWLVARQVLALAIGAGGGIYDARTRAVLCRLLQRFAVSPRLFARWENEIGGVLFEAMEAKQVVEKQKERQQKGNVWKIAGAAIGGGVLLAVTGGLAAPALAAGLASAGGAVTAAAGTVGLAAPGALLGGAIAGGGLFLTSLGTTGAAILFGGTGIGLTHWKLSTRWGALEDFEFDDLKTSKSKKEVGISVELSDKKAVKLLSDALEKGNNVLKEDVVVPSAAGHQVALMKGSRCIATRRSSVRVSEKLVDIWAFSFQRQIDQSECAVHLAVFVSGWVRHRSDFSEPWGESAKAFFPYSGHLALKWEEEQLNRLTHVFQSMITNEAASRAASMWWQTSVVGGVAAAGSVAAMALMWPVWIVSYLANLDNAWLVVAERARQAGCCLAHVLADKHAVGQRPVTLIGHSMGARLIFYCLMELYRMGEFHAVDDVVIMGTPVTARLEKWKKARAVVSGRLVNCHWGHDWLMAFCYRYLEWGISVAGLSPVDCPGVENIDLANLGLQGHEDYPNHVQEILASIRLGDRTQLTKNEQQDMTSWPIGISGKTKSTRSLGPTSSASAERKVEAPENFI